MQSLLEAHDDVAAKNYEPGGEPMPTLNTSGFLLGISGFLPDEPALTRMVGIYKSEDEPLVNISFIITLAILKTVCCSVKLKLIY